MVALLDNLNCPVCLEIKADTLIVCKYGHALCKNCAVETKRFNPSCPTCRVPFLSEPVICQPINALASALGIQHSAPVGAPVPAVASVPVPVVASVPVPVVADVPVPVAADIPVSEWPPFRGRQQLRLSIQSYIRKYKKLSQDGLVQRINVARKAAVRLRQFKHVTGGIVYDGPMPPAESGFMFGRDGLPDGEW